VKNNEVVLNRLEGDIQRVVGWSKGDSSRLLFGIVEAIRFHTEGGYTGNKADLDALDIILVLERVAYGSSYDSALVAHPKAFSNNGLQNGAMQGDCLPANPLKTQTVTDTSSPEETTDVQSAA
jgi:hypothetical protein